MCGILGIYNLDSKVVNKASITKMGNQINHRGPDGEGMFIEKNIGFVDAPVSGGEVGAINACLSVMAGGEKIDIETAKPIMDSYAKNISHYAKSQGIGFIDTSDAVSKFDDSILYALKGPHLSPLGYSIVASLIEKELK